MQSFMSDKYSVVVNIVDRLGYSEKKTEIIQYIFYGL